jgi:iron complex outermembrane receptor protein
MRSSCTAVAVIVASLVFGTAATDAQQPASGQAVPPPATPAVPDGSDPLRIRTTVVVTATRSDADLAKTPLSSSVVTAQELAARPLQTVDQQLTTTEGVYVQRLQGPSATDAHVSLRGFTGSSRTLVLLDGQPINDAYANSVNWRGLPMDEVESIEVARGPFSSLYGGNALGGVINIRTKPVDRRQLTVNADYGTYNTRRSAIRFGDRVNDRLAYSLGFEGSHTDGYNSRRFTATPGTGTGTLVTGPIPTLTTAGARAAVVGEGGENWLNHRAFRAKVEYTAGAASLLSLQYLRMDYRYGYEGYRSYLKDASGNTIDSGAVVFSDNGTLRRLSVTPNSFLQGPGEQHSNFYGGSYLHTFSSASLLRADGSYYHIPVAQFRSLGTGNTLTAGPGTMTDGKRHTLHGNVQYNQTVARHALTVGTEMRQERATNRVFALGNWTNKDSLGAQTFYATGRSINQSVYVQDQVAPSARLSVVMGARYDRWRGYDGVSDSFNATGPRTEYPSRANGQLSGKIAVGVTLPGDWNLRTSAGTSFRNPNVFDLYATSVTGSGIIFAANPSLTPERVKSWEAGVRKRFGRGPGVDAAYFYNDIDDLVYRQTDLARDPTGNYRINVNAGGGRTRGVELGVRQDLFRGMQFRGSYTYTDAVITSNPGNTAIVGKRVTFVPDHMASAQILASRGMLSTSVTGRYSGRLFSTDTNTDVIKGVPGSYSPYFTVDAGLSYGLSKKVEPFVSSENLLNRRYYTFYLSPGRTVFGGVRIRL